MPDNDPHIINFDMETECDTRLELMFDLAVGGKIPGPERLDEYKTWPRNLLQYLVDVRGGGNVTEWMDKEWGWYRKGGPGPRLKRLQAKGARA